MQARSIGILLGEGAIGSCLHKALKLTVLCMHENQA
jgi:hypothetical protein